MVSRADNVVNQHMDLFGIWNDALIVQIGPTKGDQEGTKHVDHPFHIYSVPEEPAICPVLAFCKYLLCNPTILNGECMMFDGASQYERFNNILRDIVHSPEHRNTFVDLGIDPQYFGTHSIRKGALTHVACGITSSPSIASICIRANWKMPGVMNRYIWYEAAAGINMLVDVFLGAVIWGNDLQRAMHILTFLNVMEVRRRNNSVC